MNGYSRKNLKQIAGIAVISCFIILLFFCFSMQNKKRIYNQNESYVQDNAVQTTARIDDVLKRALEDIEMMAYWFGKSLESPVVTIQDLQELTDSSDFDYVRYTGADGVNMAADGRTSYATDREYFIEGMAGKTGMSVTPSSRITSETLVNFYTPLYFQGEVIGVLRGVYLAKARMQELLKSSFFGVDAAAFLCTSDGWLISENTEAEEFTKKLKAFLESDTEGSEESREKIAQTLKDGISRGFTYRIDGNAGNGYITKLEDNDWFLIQTFPSQVTSEMYRDANEAGIILEVSLILLFAIYILTILVTNHKRSKKLLAENRDMNYVIHSLPKMYDRFVLIDLEAGTYRYMLGESPAYGGIPCEGPYPVFEKYMVKTAREDDEKEALQSFMDPEHLRESFRENTEEQKFEYQFAYGEDEWKRVSGICLERKDEVPTKILFARQNISDVKREEIARQNVLKEATRVAEASSKAKSAFLFNMSHDIRTPMNAIIGFANMAEKKIDDKETVRDYIHKIQKSSDILLKIINDVLDLARIESGKASLHFSSKDIHERLSIIKDMFEESMKEKGIHFTVESNLEDSCVLCDDLRLNQILINLLSNACKFTPMGGSVSLRASQLGKAEDGKAEYEFVVKDTGIGMEESFLSRVFDAFEREQTSTVSGIQGTGLGLSIVKHLIDMMGGTIDIKSRKGEGTEVTVHLSFQIVDKAEIASANESVLSSKTYEGKRVLLVEDNDLNREIARELLKMQGFFVEEARDGTEAIEKVSNSVAGFYDLILMDIQMPKMNGYEATKAIRKLPNPALARIPIVAMTANAFEEDKKAAADAGMNGHIGKPIHVEKMQREIERALSSGSPDK